MTATKLRTDLSKVISDIEDNHEKYVITKGNIGVVMMSLEEYTALENASKNPAWVTADVLQDVNNALDSVEAGNTFPYDPDNYPDE